MGNVTVYTYDTTERADHVLEKIEEPNLGSGEPTTTFTYSIDGKANIEKATLPDSAERNWTYNGTFSQPTKFTDELGRETYFEIDSNNGNVLYVQQVVGTKDSVTYNSSTGAVSNVSDDIVTSFLYTAAPTLSTHPPGGLLKSVFDPNGNETTYIYYTTNLKTGSTIDSMRFGRLEKITFPKTTVETTAPTREFEYDELGNVSKITETGDSLSRFTTYEYDDLNRLLKETLPDPDGIESQVSPVYEYFYDSLNRLTAAVDPVVPTGDSNEPTVGPTTATINVYEDAADTHFDLTAHFSDDEDTAHGLTYEIVSNSNSALFDSLSTVAAGPGILVLDYANDKAGTATIKVHASDSDFASEADWSADLTITVTVTAGGFQINPSTPGEQERASVTALPDGGFVVGWSEETIRGSDYIYRVLVRRYDGGGNAVTNEIEVDSVTRTTNSNDHNHISSVAMLDDDTFVVVWRAHNGSNYDIYYRMYDIDGTALGSQQTANSYTSGNQHYPQVAATPTGGFIIAWSGSGSGGSGDDVYFRRFDSAGVAIDTSDQRANNPTTGTQFFPSVAVADDGSYLVAWVGDDTGDWGVYARKYDFAGNAIDGETRINETTPRRQYLSSVTHVGDGEYIVVWSDNVSTSGTNYDIYARRISSSGVPLGSQFVVGNTTSSEKWPRVTGTGDGGWVATWHTNKISARRYDKNDSPIGAAFVVTTSGYNPDVDLTSDGRLVFTWEKYTSGNPEVRARFMPGPTADPGPFRVLSTELDPVLRGPVKRLLVTFSEPIDGTTIITGNFSLTDPNSSNVSITSAMVVGASQALLELTNTITVLGDYSLTVDAIVENSDDEKMDQDRDGTAGESTDDKYTTTFRYDDNLVTTYQYDAVGRQTGMVDTGGFHSMYTYTHRGELASFTDPLDRTTRYEYDPRGLLSKLILPDPGGAGSPTTQYFYDAGSNLIKTIDAEDNETEYQYDNRHRMTDLWESAPTGVNEGKASSGGNPVGPVTTYYYNGASELYATTDPEGHHLWYTFDDVGRLIRSAELGNVDTTVDDDSASYDGTWTDDGSSGGYGGGDDHYSSSGSGSNKATWAFTGLTAGETYEVLVTWVADTGNATDAPYTVYDGSVSPGNSLGTFDLDQKEEPATFDDHKWFTLGDFTVTGTTLNVQLTNDANGDVRADAIRIVDSAGATDYEYDAAGNLTLATDAPGSATEHVYDARHRRTDTYLPNPSTGAANQTGPHTKFDYDTLGNLVTLTDPDDNATRYVYDNLQRQTHAIQPLHDASATAYSRKIDAGDPNDYSEPSGTWTSVTSGDNSENAFDDDYKYSPSSDAKAKWTFDDLTVGKEYEILVSWAWHESNSIDAAYEVLDNTTSEGTFTVNQKIAPGDVLGQAATTWATLGVFTADNTTMSVELTAGTADDVEADGVWFLEAGPHRKFEYDPVGNLTKLIDREGRVTDYTFDKRYLMTTEEWFADVDDITADRTLSFTFDAAGQLTAASDPSAAYDYEYDDLGRATKVTSDITGLTDDVVFDQVFDSLGRRTEVDATIGTTADFLRKYQYDALSRMSQVMQEDQVGGNVIPDRRVDFEYNDIGQFTKISRFYNLAGGATYEAATSTYGYDALGRLNSLDHKKSTTLISGYDWTHDVLHRVTKMDFTNTAYDSEDIDEYNYDTNDQLLEAKEGQTAVETYTYDDNGNRTMTGYQTGTNNQLTEDGTYNYTYDKEGNRTEKYVDGNNSNTLDSGDTDVTLYEWDHRNRLTKITIQAVYGTTDTTIDYGYDVFDRRVFKDKGREVYWVWDGQQLALEFNFTQSLNYRFLYGPGIDQILTQGVYWHLPDHLGTTRDLIDEDGDHVQHFEFDSYGRLLNSPIFTSLLLFNGREYDQDTKMYYVRARWYDPHVGRWASEDPIGYAGQDTNLYRYVANSPVNYTDPSGLADAQSGGLGILNRSLRSISSSKDAKSEAARIAAAIKKTFDKNSKWNWAALSVNNDKCKGYYCYEWAAAFRDAFNYESTGEFFTAEYEDFGDLVSGKVHSFLTITSKETGESIYVDDGFWNGNHVHTKPPKGGIYNTPFDVLTSEDADIPPFYDHLGWKGGDEGRREQRRRDEQAELRTAYPHF